MPSPAKLAHVVLYSRQVPVMRDWYVNVLDAHVVYETPTLSFITYDNEHHRIAIGDPVAAQKMGEEALKVVGSTPTVAELSLEELAALPRHGLAHIAFTYDTLADLLGNWERLDEQSVRPILTVNHGTTTSMYYADPDGNQIELQVDNFDTAEEGTAFLESESFARNPVGELFDPADLLTRLRAGEDPAKLTVPTW